MKTAPEQNEQLTDFSGDPRWELVQRIIESPHLIGSARLRDFLLHVTACAIRETPEEATEQQIGIQVFQRSPGFNSSEDSIVRSQARLLRLKLSAYFNAEGATEPLIMEIPKGHYLPLFSTGPLPPAETQAELSAPLPPSDLIEPDHPLHEDPPSEPHTPNRSRKWIIATLSLACLIAAALGVTLWQHHDATLQPVNRLWAPFFKGDPPLIIYSNALFVGDSRTGMRYAAKGDTDRDAVDHVDSYTGIGELVSVHELTKLFDRNAAEFVLKRSLLVTWDEARSRNLVFIGSGAENSSLKALSTIQNFSFIATPDASGIVNQHPLPGEPSTYMRPEHPLTKDYALIALLPGVQPNLHTFIFSGLTTYGTQAAVEYAYTPATATELLKRISPDGKVHDFEAVLEVPINGGVPLQPKLLTLRLH